MHYLGLLPVVSCAPCTNTQHVSLTCVCVAGGELARSSSVGRLFSQNQAQMVATRVTMPVKKIRTTSMAMPVNADSGTSLSQIAILVRGRSYFKVVYIAPDGRWHIYRRPQYDLSPLLFSLH